MIRIGSAGTGGLGYSYAIPAIARLGLNALEVEFTHGVHMSCADAKAIGRLAKEHGISLSVHAPYFINLASDEPEKVRASAGRILDSCEKAHYLGAGIVVFHAGFYQKKTPEETYELIRAQMEYLLDEIRVNSWNVVLAPEITGKESQFGSLDELFRLMSDTGCSMTVDFAHLRARRQGEIDYDGLMEQLKNRIRPHGHIHAHFSGIEWTAKGEKRHIPLTGDVIAPFASSLRKHFAACDNQSLTSGKNTGRMQGITIICESPDPIGDAVKIKSNYLAI